MAPSASKVQRRSDTSLIPARSSTSQDPLTELAVARSVGERRRGLAVRFDRDHRDLAVGHHAGEPLACSDVLEGDRHRVRPVPVGLHGW